MQIDPDRFWPLNSLPNRLPKNARGRRIHVATCFRWASHGLSGRKLKTIRIGGQIFCCDAWLADFLAAPRDSELSPSAPSESRSAAVDAAEQELSRMGL